VRQIASVPGSLRNDRSAQLLLSGESMEVVLLDEVERLQRLVLLRDAQVAEMRERLWAMDEPWLH